MGGNVQTNPRTAIFVIYIPWYFYRTVIRSSCSEEYSLAPACKLTGRGSVVLAAACLPKHTLYAETGSLATAAGEMGKAGHAPRFFVRDR